MNRSMVLMAVVLVVAGVAGFISTRRGSASDFAAWTGTALQDAKRDGRPAVLLATADW